MDWNFADADTQELTHGLCYYPARMVPQIAARLLDTYCQKPGVIVDPFAGSGTTLLESLLRKHRVVGIDVNPVAITLARAKCTLLDKPVDVTGLWEHVNAKNVNVKLDADPMYLQAKRNIDYWYDRDIAERLLALRLGIIQYLETTDSPSQQWVLWVTLMGTIYACSKGIQDGSSFHTRKTPPNQHDPFQIYDRKLKENLARISQLTATCTKQGIHLKEGTLPQILNGEAAAQFNLTQGNALTILKEIPSGSVTGIVTSPPYGDEHSTVNYTRYTKHAAYWLGFSPADVKKMSGETLSSRKQDTLPKGIPTTEEVLAQIKDINASDYPKVVHFLSEFYQCLTQCQRILTAGAACAIVIANRRVRNVEIPMDVITTELASPAGLQQETIFYRTFPKKVVAWKTISGKSMDQENIVILRK
jgi:site-specific DNA-methyltransferase (cytosine-N4-specific)